MNDFNRKDHIAVTIAEGGEKKYLLRNRIKSVTPVGNDPGTGPTRLIYCQDETGAETISYVVSENAEDLVRELNGEPNAIEHERMKQDTVADRKRGYQQKLAELVVEYQKPDPETARHEKAAEDLQADIDTREKAVAAFENTKRTLRSRFVEFLYLREKEQARQKDPRNYIYSNDSLLLKIIGIGQLGAIKAWLDNKAEIEESRERQDKYFAQIEKQKNQREELYQRRKTALERLRDEPAMTVDDRSRLEQKIQAHRDAFGPGEEFRFMRNGNAYDRRSDIRAEKSRQRTEALTRRAEALRRGEKLDPADEEQERELTRSRRSRGRGFDRER